MPLFPNQNTVDAGPVTGNAVLDVPAGSGNQGIEAHMLSGAPSNSPSTSPIIDPGVAPSNYQGNTFTPINTTVGTSKIVNPA